MHFSERPLQWQADVGEIVVAYRIGGEPLALRSYRAIIEARKLPQFAAMAMSNDVRQVLKDNNEFRDAIARKQ